MSNCVGCTVNTFPTIGVLTMIFVVLKLTHVIDWSFWWVFSPLWISAAFSAFVIVVFLVIAVLAAMVDK